MLKPQIQNYKSQINSNYQAQNSNIFVFGTWNFDFIWNLVLEIWNLVYSDLIFDLVKDFGSDYLLA